MPRINIEEIKEELNKSGWVLVSETYQNLDTNMEYKCD